MSCLIPLVAGACLLDPSHVLIRADSHWQVSHGNYNFTYGKPYNGGIARIELMAGGDVSRSFRLYYGVGHQSFVTVRDGGMEYIIAGVEWHPF